MYKASQTRPRQEHTFERVGRERRFKLEILTKKKLG